MKMIPRIALVLLFICISTYHGFAHFKQISETEPNVSMGDILQLAQAKPDSALEVFYDFSSRFEVDSSIIVAHYDLCVTFYKNDHQNHLKELLEVGLKLPFDSTLFDAYGWLYSLWVKNVLREKKLDSAEMIADTYLELAEQNKSLIHQIKALQNKGAVLQFQNRQTEALTIMQEAIKKAELLDMDRYKCGPYENLAEAYSDLNELEKAIKYHKKAMEYAISSNEPIVEQQIVNNLGLTYQKLEKYDSAILFFRKLEKMSVESKNTFVSLLSNINIGVCQINLKQYDSAEIRLKKGILGFEKMNDPFGVMLCNYNLSKLYNAQNQFNTALIRAKNALQICEENAYNSMLMNMHEQLYLAYEGLQNYKNAFTHHKAFSNLQKEELNQDKQRELGRLESQIELDQAGFENDTLKRDKLFQQEQIAKQALIRNLLIGGVVLLVLIVVSIYRSERIKTKKNKEINAQNEIIVKSLDEKEALLKEIHHRVKNNLQVISSLLNMQSRSTENEEILEAFQEGQSRVKAMSLIHQKLYQTENLTEIDFEDYTSQLIGQLAALYKIDKTTVDQTIDIKNIKLDIDTAIPLGLILNELISNSYKYAFGARDKGEIHIELARTDQGKLQLEISDNGEGLPSDIDLQKTKTLGLRLVNVLTKQLNGNLSYESSPKSRFIIEFQEIRLSA